MTDPVTCANCGAARLHVKDECCRDCSSTQWNINALLPVAEAPPQDALNLAPIKRYLPPLGFWSLPHERTIHKLIAEIERLRAASCVSRTPAEPEGWIELRLRQEWWTGHGCPFAALYGDDGEMQCNALTCVRDFKREPMDALRKHVDERRLMRVSEALSATQPLPPSPAEKAPTR